MKTPATKSPELVQAEADVLKASEGVAEANRIHLVAMARYRMIRATNPSVKALYATFIEAADGSKGFYAVEEARHALYAAGELI